MVLTQTFAGSTGIFIINDHKIELVKGQVVSYRDDAVVQTFTTKETMEAAHKAQFPDKYTLVDGKLVLTTETGVAA